MKYITQHIKDRFLIGNKVGMLLWAAVSLTGFTACDNLFNVETKQFSTEEIFLQDKAWPTASRAGLYKTFHSEYYQFDHFINGDVGADVAYAGGDNTANFEIDDYNISTTNGNVRRDWSYLFAGIKEANTVLAGIDRSTAEGFTDAERMILRGEAKFIRAFHYFNLVRLWGGVPLVLSNKIAETQSLPRATEEEIYAQIVADLTDAIEALPKTQADVSRIRKATAQGLLAKVYASMPTANYAKVVEYSDAVLADTQYGLVANFADLFDGKHENTRESLFEIQYDSGTAGAWGPQLLLPPSISFNDWKKFNTPTKALVEAYTSENDNVRKNASIIFEDCTGKYTDDVWGTLIPFAYKLKMANAWNSSNNIILLRLADIILLKAEALNEQGNLPGAETLLNQIRTRAGLAAKHPASQAEMRLAIEKERFMELAFEGHRWFDLKRTKRLVEVMRTRETRRSATSTYGAAVSETDLYWPVPVTEINLNGNLVQNNGYN